MNLDELETPCAACTHTLADHLNGAGPWDWCQACADCPNFITGMECVACFGRRTIEGHDGVERKCAACGGSGNA